MVSLFAIASLGFFLGMRHATDPDHVIAVTTIVSRERKIGKAAWIGAIWGLGHTLTIFVVGGAIILFGVVIPPRVGLSMELSVGLMLIVLGAMNLAGFLRGVPETVARGTEGPDDMRRSHPHPHRGPDLEQKTGRKTRSLPCPSPGCSDRWWSASSMGSRAPPRLPCWS